MKNIILSIICTCCVAAAYAQAPKKRPALFGAMQGTWLGPKISMRVTNPDFCSNGEVCNTIHVYLYEQKLNTKEDSLNLQNGNLYPDYELVLVYRMYDLDGVIDYRIEVAILNYKDTKKPSRASVGQSVYVDDTTVVLEIAGDKKQYISFNITNGILYLRQGYDFTSYTGLADVKEQGDKYTEFNGGK